MTDEPARPVLGRPPVEAEDEELVRWVEEFLHAVLGPTPWDDELRPGSEPTRTS